MDLPRSLEVAGGLTEDEHTGHWYLLQADHPNDAYLHVRGPGGAPNQTRRGLGPCDSCQVIVLAEGPTESVADAFDAEPAFVPVSACRPLPVNGGDNLK